jgi:LysM repeat protein
MKSFIVRPRIMTGGRNRARCVVSLVSIVALTGTAGTLSAQQPATLADSTRKPAPTIVPQSPPAEGEVRHLVKKGDTLWDIAKAYLKDPFRWPEVFQRNTDVVENPHWIYPGEVIRIANGEVRPEVLARLNTKPAPVTEEFDRTVFSPLPARPNDRVLSNGKVIGREQAGAVRAGEVDAAPFVDRDGGPSGAGRLAAAYDRPGIDANASDQRFQMEDPVFVELPRGRTANVGDRYLAFAYGPAIGDDSQLMIPTAIVRVESGQYGQLTLVRIVRQFGEVKLDQSLIPLESVLPSAALARTPVANGGTAHVLWVHEDPVLPSVQSYVVLSGEAGNSVRVGDQFTLIDASIDPTHPAPPVPAAVAQVVRVTPYAVTAIVVNHDQPTIRPGMPARLTATMR